MRYNLLILSILVLTRLGAQVGGTSTYQFLKLTNSARLAALGGENVSINDGDLNFVFHNPALLKPEMSKNLVLNYVNYFAGINYGYVAYSKDYEKNGTLASGLHYINYGKFIKADEKGKITGEFRAYELALNLFWSKPVLDSLLTFGVNLKPIYSQLERYNSFGLACDLGLNYLSSDKLFSASFVIKNAGSQLKPYYSGSYEPLPFDLQVGVSQKLEHAPFRVSLLLHHLHRWDMTYDVNSNLAYTAVEPDNTFETDSYKFDIFDNLLRHSIFSTEFIPSKNFIVMIGYNHQRRKELSVETRPFLVGFSWGFYLKISKLRLSFGQAIYHLAGSSKHFSINLNLDEFYKRNN